MIFLKSFSKSGFLEESFATFFKIVNFYHFIFYFQHLKNLFLKLKLKFVIFWFFRFLNKFYSKGILFI